MIKEMKQKIRGPTIDDHRVNMKTKKILIISRFPYSSVGLSASAHP